MGYESDPAGLGVGKRYGALDAGNVGGKIGGVDASQQVVFQCDYADSAGAEAQSVYIPENSRITKCEVRVDTAFSEALSEIDVHLDGTTILNAVQAVTTAGYFDVTLAAAANLLVGTSPEALTVVYDTQMEASTAGAVTVVVTYTTA